MVISMSSDLRATPRDLHGDGFVTPSELARWRDDTPGCARCVHLNNAGAALMPRSVSGAMTAYLARESESGGYETADESEAAFEEAYAAVARLIDATPRNIAIVENATV